jgi:cysteine desulfurase
MPFFTDTFGNASSIHQFGREVKSALNKSRETVANFINAASDEIYFTSGGTESDNWAIKGIARANKSKGNHIITTTVEHHAVLHTCEILEKEGFEVTYLKVDEYGLINLDDLRNAITDKTILVSVMYVNNEIGTVQPIAEIGSIAKEKGIIFHTDAVQALGNMNVDVKLENIDLLSASGHKLYGPKGVGFLYVKKGIKIQNILDGGAQERKRRPGTENMPGIVGLAKAIELAASNFDAHISHTKSLRDKMIKRVLSEIPYTRLNGHPEKRHPGNTNFCFEFIEGESLLLSLDMVGIAGSSGSACTSGSLDPSHVLLAIGLPHEIAHGSLRLSLGDFNTEEDVDYAVDNLKVIVDRLRSYSPLYEKVAKKNK